MRIDQDRGNARASEHGRGGRAGKTTADDFQCQLSGTTVPLSPEQLAQLYPTHTDYVLAVTRAAAQGVLKGFLLPADAAEIVRDAVH